jgi:hypothetical protein
MKTITLKADERFDSVLTKLAEKTSLKIRSEARRVADDLNAANADGL